MLPPPSAYLSCAMTKMSPQWATEHGARVAWTPGLGLSAAVMAGVSQLAGEGTDLAVVAHADLPFAAGLATLGAAGRITLVPDRRRDGTNVAVVPTGRRVRFCIWPRKLRTSSGGGRSARTCLRDRLRPPPRPRHRPTGGLGARPRGNLTRWNRTFPSRRGRWQWEPIPTTSNSAAAARSLNGRSNGCEILHLICTDGSKGTWDPGHDPAELVVTGATSNAPPPSPSARKGEVVFLGWPDGELESGLRQRFEVAACHPQVQTRRRARPRPVEALQVAPRPPQCWLSRHRRHRCRPRSALFPGDRWTAPPAEDPALVRGR